MPPVRCTDMNMWGNHCLGYGLIICISIWKFHTNLLQSHPFLYPSLTMSRVSALSSNSSFLWNTLDKAPRFPPPFSSPSSFPLPILHKPHLYLPMLPNRFIRPRQRYPLAHTQPTHLPPGSPVEPPVRGDGAILSRYVPGFIVSLCRELRRMQHSIW